MDTNTFCGLSLAQEQAGYLEDFSKNPQKYYDDHKKAAERLRIYQHTEAVNMAPAPRRGLFQDDSALRSLCGEIAGAMDSTLMKNEIYQETQSASRTFHHGDDADGTKPISYCTSMQHNRTGLPRRDQTVYLQPQDSAIALDPVIDDQTSVKARSPDRDSSMSYAQTDHGALGQRLNTTLTVKNNTPSSPPLHPTPSTPQTRLLNAPRAHHIRDSTFSYVRQDYGALQQCLGIDLVIAQDLPDVFGARDDWSGDDSAVYDRSMEEQYECFSSSKPKRQLYENPRAKAEAKVEAKMKELKKWMERKFR